MLLSCKIITTIDLMDKQVYIKRGGGIPGVSEGTLILPSVNEDQSETLEIHGVKIIVMIKDIFSIRGHSVIVIPNYRDGILYNMMRDLNVDVSGNMISNIIETIPSRCEGIINFILYNYDREKERLDDEFEEIGKVCPPGSDLVLPTFGTRNGVSFFKVASRIFYGLLSCLNNERSSLRNLGSIIITTKFDPNQDASSMRVIKHLFNLIAIHEKTQNEPECLMCCDMKRDVILNCGHRIACARCILDIKKVHNVCPLCHIPITKMYPCYTVTDMSQHVCGEGHIKAGKIFVPCGHYNASCLDCESIALTDGKCPICQENIMTSIRLYQ